MLTQLKGGGGPLLTTWQAKLLPPDPFPPGVHKKGIDSFVVPPYETIEVGYRRMLGYGKQGSKAKLHHFEAHWTQKGKWAEPEVSDIEPGDERFNDPSPFRVLGAFTDWGRIEVWMDYYKPRCFTFVGAWDAVPCEVKPTDMWSGYSANTSGTAGGSTLTFNYDGSNLTVSGTPCPPNPYYYVPVPPSPSVGMFQQGSTSFVADVAATKAKLEAVIEAKKTLDSPLQAIKKAMEVLPQNAVDTFTEIGHLDAEGLTLKKMDTNIQKVLEETNLHQEAQSYIGENEDDPPPW
jgi:hypothetical protein